MNEDLSPEGKLDLILENQRTILEGIGLILAGMVDCDCEDEEDDFESMPCEGGPQ